MDESTVGRSKYIAGSKELSTAGRILGEVLEEDSEEDDKPVSTATKAIESSLKQAKINSDKNASAKPVAKV